MASIWSIETWEVPTMQPAAGLNPTQQLVWASGLSRKSRRAQASCESWQDSPAVRASGKACHEMKRVENCWAKLLKIYVAHASRSLLPRQVLPVARHMDSLFMQFYAKRLIKNWSLGETHTLPCLLPFGTSVIGKQSTLCLQEHMTHLLSRIALRFAPMFCCKQPLPLQPFHRHLHFPPANRNGERKRERLHAQHIEVQCKTCCWPPLSYTTELKEWKLLLHIQREALNWLPKNAMLSFVTSPITIPTLE